jgi:predicted nucleotidyltransferase
MATIQTPINQEFIVCFCKKWGIVRMALFGSVLRDDFRPDSDVDVMVWFASQTRWSLLDIVEMKFELQEAFGRDVDIIEDGTIKNPIKRRCIYENLQVIYES